MLKIDFGSEKEYFHLYKQCYELQQKEYTYKFCPFDTVKQDSTSLGSWGFWEGNYSKMKYTDGIKCWDGPVRQTTVTLQCGKTNAILKIEEPSRCEYALLFATPSACDINHANVLELESEEQSH